MHALASRSTDTPDELRNRSTKQSSATEVDPSGLSGKHHRADDRAASEEQPGD